MDRPAASTNGYSERRYFTSVDESGFDSLLFDLFPEAAYVCDHNGLILKFNQKAAELWGRRPQIGDPADRFCGSFRMYRLDGSFLPHADCPMGEVLATGVAVRDRKVVVERPDGERCVASVTIEPLRDAQGRIVGAINCFRECPDMQDLATRQSRAVLDVLPAAIYTTDAEGRIDYFNEAAVQIWGRRPEIGVDRFCGSARMFRIDGRATPLDESPMARALQRRRAILGAELLVERPDGARVQILAFPTPLFDEAGGLVGAINLLVDITEHRRAQEASWRLAAIVASSDDAIVSKNLDGMITSWNEGAQRLFGYASEEVLGQPITMLIPPERLDEEPAILARIRRGERVEPFETVRRRKDGSLIHLSLTISPILGPDGAIIGASKIARDITERRQAQERQELLLREMNHRVKNLFAVASGVVRLSARAAESAADLAATVQARLDALAQAHNLVVPDPQAGLAQAKPATLHALIRVLLSPYEAPGDPARISVEGPDLPLPRANLSALALLLHEFATNAAKYGALSSEEGRIDIACREADGRYHMIWTERGGPLITPARHEGFGSVLARTALRGELDGWLDQRWDPEGLVITLSIALGEGAGRA